MQKYFYFKINFITSKYLVLTGAHKYNMVFQEKFQKFYNITTLYVCMYMYIIDYK